MFCFLAYDTIGKFMSDQTLIKISKHEHSISEIPFPAVTMCPEPAISELRIINILHNWEYIRK